MESDALVVADPPVKRESWEADDLEPTTLDCVKAPIKSAKETFSHAKRSRNESNSNSLQTSTKTQGVPAVSDGNINEAPGECGEIEICPINENAFQKKMVANTAALIMRLKNMQDKA